MKKKITTILAAVFLIAISITGCTNDDSTKVDTERSADEIKMNLDYSDKYDSTYVNEITKTVNAVNANSSDDSISYLFISDTHIGADGGAQDEFMYEQLYAASDVAKNSDVDFICVGGDIEDGKFVEADGGKQKALEILNKVSEILKASGKPVFILKGNHDDNSFSAQVDASLLYNPEYIIDSDEWYEATMGNFTEYYNDYQDGYFYYDLRGKNTRVICLNMSNSTDTVTDGLREEMGMYYYGYHDEQIDWLLNKAMTKEDTNYVFLCHDGFSYHQGYNEKSNRDTLESILNSAYTHTSFVNDKFSKDFSGWSGKVLLYNHGHMHMESAMLMTDMGGLPVLSTESAHIFNYSGNANANMANWSGYSRDDNRTVGEVKSAVFDIVTYNKDKIDIVRFGNGSEREIDI